MEDLYRKVSALGEEIDLQLFAEDEDDTGKDDVGDTGKDDVGKKDDKDGGDAGKKTDVRTFSQDELNAIIKDRIQRERASWEKKIEDEKKKAAMTESERLKAEKEETEKKAKAMMDRANERLIRAEVIAQATALKIVDADAAYALMSREGVSVEEDGQVIGVKAALESLIKAKPYLVRTAVDTKKTGDDQSDDKGKKGGFSMNDLIRKAAGRF